MSETENREYLFRNGMERSDKVTGRESGLSWKAGTQIYMGFNGNGPSKQMTVNLLIWHKKYKLDAEFNELW